MNDWTIMYCKDGFIEGIECEDIKLTVTGDFDTRASKEKYCNKLINIFKAEYEAIHQRKKVVNFF